MEQYTVNKNPLDGKAGQYQIRVATVYEGWYCQGYGRGGPSIGAYNYIRLFFNTVEDAKKVLEICGITDVAWVIEQINHDGASFGETVEESHIARKIREADDLERTQRLEELEAQVKKINAQPKEYYLPITDEAGFLMTRKEEAFVRSGQLKSFVHLTLYSQKAKKSLPHFFLSDYLTRDGKVLKKKLFESLRWKFTDGENLKEIGKAMPALLPVVKVIKVRFELGKLLEEDLCQLFEPKKEEEAVS